MTDDPGAYWWEFTDPHARVLAAGPQLVDHDFWPDSDVTLLERIAAVLCAILALMTLYDYD